ncbi:MAG: ATP-binding protein [Acidobacteriota bacterium]|nr:ATP-binding protein [Acidobacteriota bacterium]
MDPGRLKELFLEESRTHLDTAYEQFATLMTAEKPALAIGALLRSSHSLKGMAATMGYEPMVELAHALEDRFEIMRDEALSLDEVQEGACRTALALLAVMIDQAESGQPSPSPEAQTIVAQLRRPLLPTAQTPERKEDESPQRPPVSEPAVAKASSADAAPRSWRVECSLERGDPPRAAIRALKRLAEVGTIDTIHPPRVSGDPSEVSYRIQVTLLHPGPHHQLERQLGALFADAPLIIEPQSTQPKGVVERSGTGGWCRVHSEDIDRAFSAVRDLLQHQEGPFEADRMRRTARGAYASMRRLRLIEFSEISTRLHATVQQALSDTGRQAELRIEGGEERLDRSNLETLLPSLQHLLRNAVAHGIEPPTTREGNGKPARGAIVVRLSRRDRYWRLTVRDDGHGIDTAALRVLAVERGLLDASRAQAAPETVIRDLVFRPAFSSREDVDTLSGRGVGLDAVKHAMESLGGRVDFESQPGVYTEFVCEYPQQSSLQQALVVRSSESHYAFPLDCVNRVVDIEGLTSEPGRQVGLQEWLGIDDSRRTSSENYAVVIHDEDGPIAIRVDDVLGRRELLTQPVGPPLSRLTPYSLFATLEDGCVVMVLDLTRIDETGYHRER